MNDYTNIYNSKLSDNDFNKISKFIGENYGIRLPPLKKAMVQNRLYKRLKATKINTFDSYIKYVFSTEGKKEIEFMVNEISTNKTDFFREDGHYEFLKEIVTNSSNSVRVWSAGCSTGEEPITLAMVLQEKAKRYNIFGSDISTSALNKAKNAIFTTDKTKDIPDNLLKKYFDKNILEKKITYKAKDILTKNIKYGQINFMSSNYGISNIFDIIFFRNVLIYFNIETQKQILHKVLKNLKPGGYLFIGHSEAIYDHSLNIKNVNPSVYIKQ